jgi:hypothetical protein
MLRKTEFVVAPFIVHNHDAVIAVPHTVCIATGLLILMNVAGNVDQTAVVPPGSEGQSARS